MESAAFSVPAENNGQGDEAQQGDAQQAAQNHQIHLVAGLGAGGGDFSGGVLHRRRLGGGRCWAGLSPPLVLGRGQAFQLPERPQGS